MSDTTADQSAYYWAVIGRILFDDEDTVHLTDLPTTQAEAIAQFHDRLRSEDPDAYREHGAIVCHLLRSTDLIFDPC